MPLSRRLRVGAAAGLAVVVAATALTLARSAVQPSAVPRSTTPPSATPLPVNGTPVQTAPLCRIPESATPDGTSYDVDPTNQPAGRLRSCPTAGPQGRLASAFGFVRQGTVSLSPFAITLPAGWTVSPDPTRSNGWVNGMAGNGSHVLRLRSADGSSGVDFVTAPSPAQVLNSDPVTPMHAYGAKALVSREARGLADWTRSQPWIRTDALVRSSVGGLPAWTVDTAPRTGADTEAERGSCAWEDAGCLLFFSYYVQGDRFGGRAAYLRPGTSRLVYFDAPPASDEWGSASVVAVLWDKRTTPAGLDHIVMTVQPIIDSIRFPGTTLPSSTPAPTASTG